MADENPVTAGSVAPGSESSPAASAAPAAAGTAGSTDPGAWQPDERYKGMQRELQKANDRARQLEGQLQQAQASAGTAGAPDNAAIIALLRELAATGPEGQARAQQLALQIQSAQERAELERLRNQQAFSENAARIHELQTSNMEELKAIARDMGADPDSGIIDYGTDTEPLYERMRKVRESAKAAVKPAAPAPVNEAAQAAPANASHNTQPGIAPAPQAKRTAVTADDVEVAMAAYSRNPTKENMAKLDEVTDAFQTSLA